MPTRALTDRRRGWKAAITKRGRAILHGAPRDTPIAAAIRADLDHRRVVTHPAPTGSGKSHAAAQVAARRDREGRCTPIAVPSRQLAEEARRRIAEFAPDAVAAGALAVVRGGRPRPADGIEDDEEAESLPEDTGEEG
jgi:hypothetical protein